MVKGRLGDRLLEKGQLTAEQLDLALGEQRRAHRPLGEILLSLSFVKEEDITSLIAEDLGIEFLRVGDFEPDPMLTAALDAAFVRETLSFPFALVDGTLRVALVEPGDPEKVAGVRSRFPYPLEVSIITESDLQKLMRDYLPKEDGQVKQLFDGLAASDEKTGEDDFPVERVANAVLLDGVHRGATDIHIEPDERVTRVRYRVDGILTQGENLPAEATAAIVSRVKILAGLDISERRRPQDGRIRMGVDDRQIDMRVSIMPCTFGENVVIRILDRAAGGVRLEQLGIPTTIQKHLGMILERSHGLFLVTGPTGSGKTTTLYSMLAMIDAVRRNVATIEDPVEYQVPLLRQSQVDTSIDFSFNEGLRSLLRQDPDVILVGEIRDQETADMAVKASMTGHLVFATLHTNSSIGAIPRLIDIGVDAFLIEDSLIGVLAQRLVRKVCNYCKKPAELSERDLAWLDGNPGQPMIGEGCDRCGGSGYSGRACLAELFLPDETLAAAIHDGADASQLKETAIASGFLPMEHDGKEKVRLGITTRAEVERVNRSHRLSKEEREDV